MNYQIIRNSKLLSAESLHNLRLAVNWPSSIEDSQKELENSYSTFSTWDNGFFLTGYVNIISDGVSDALITNLMVKPEYRKRGIGSALVTEAVSSLRKDGIKFFNVVFVPELEEFYRKCGFEIISGGVMDFT